MFFGLGHPGRQMLGRNPKAALLNSASLSLDFMTPGVLDPRITFTRASTATYFDTSGVMQTATTNAPRWDYDPSTLQLRGLLLEEARTNMIVNSDLITGWTQGNIVRTPSSGTAPDGTNTLVRLAEAATTSNHISIAPLLTIVAATVYTFTVYAKAQENRYVQLVFDDNTANGVVANFDLQTGTLASPASVAGTATSVTSTIQAMGNGIYRCSATCATNATTTGRAVVALINASNAARFQNYTGNTANGLLVWGAQLEVGAFPTSYIPTTGVAVTRAVDVCSVLTVAPWYNASAGSLMAEFSIPQAASPGTQGGIVRLDDATDSNSASMFVVTGSGVTFFYAAVGGVAQLNNSPNVVVNGTPQKVALNYGGGLWRYAENGVVGNGIASAVPLPITRMLIGNASSTQGAWKPNGHIRTIRYWSRALSDTEMQSVTTL